MNRILAASVFYALSFFVTQPTHAQATVANGGDIVICDPTVALPAYHKPRMLDTLEAQLRKFPIDLGGPTLNREQKIQLVLDRIEKIDRFWGSALKGAYADFWTETLMIQNVFLPDVPDSIPVALPKGCHIEQIAIQTWDSNLFVGEARYTINEGLWNLLDSDNQAVLVIHELALRAYLHLDDASRRARFFTGLVIQKNIPMEAYVGMYPFGDKFYRYSVVNREIQESWSSIGTSGFIAPDFYSDSSLKYERNQSFRSKFMENYFKKTVPVLDSKFISQLEYAKRSIVFGYRDRLQRKHIAKGTLVRTRDHSNGVACTYASLSQLIASDGRSLGTQVILSPKGKVCGASTHLEPYVDENYVQVDPSPECTLAALFKGGNSPCD
jgi:hypothetical protein